MTLFSERGSIRAALARIEGKVDGLMSGFDDLNAAVANLQTQVTAENTELGQIVQGLQAAQAQITQLQQQIASGGTVTDAQLEQVAQSIATVATGAQQAVAAAQQAEPTPPAGG